MKKFIFISTFVFKKEIFIKIKEHKRKRGRRRKEELKYTEYFIEQKYCFVLTKLIPGFHVNMY